MRTTTTRTGEGLATVGKRAVYRRFELPVEAWSCHFPELSAPAISITFLVAVVEDVLRTDIED
jgi:hypothetical protein